MNYIYDFYNGLCSVFLRVNFNDIEFCDILLFL